MNATRNRYNPTRVLRNFHNPKSLEGAALLYFEYNGKHVVILRRGSDDDLIAREETIEKARTVWKTRASQLNSEGFHQVF